MMFQEIEMLESHRHTAIPFAMRHPDDYWKCLVSKV